MAVPVYKRILDLFEAEGVNTLFGIPDPNFVHMFARGGCARVVGGGTASRAERGIHGRGSVADDG